MKMAKWLANFMIGAIILLVTPYFSGLAVEEDF